MRFNRSFFLFLKFFLKKKLSHRSSGQGPRSFEDKEENSTLRIQEVEASGACTECGDAIA
jgi:hypothetical protein